MWSSLVHQICAVETLINKSSSFSASLYINNVSISKLENQFYITFSFRSLLCLQSIVIMRFLVVAFLALFVTLSYCRADDQFVNVVGFAECADCAKSGIKPNQAFSGT